MKTLLLRFSVSVVGRFAALFSFAVAILTITLALFRIFPMPTVEIGTAEATL